MNEEDDLYDILNESLNREDLGRTSLEDQMEFGTGQDWQDGMHDEEVVKPKEYDFSEYTHLLLSFLCASFFADPFQHSQTNLIRSKNRFRRTGKPTGSSKLAALSPLPVCWSNRLSGGSPPQSSPRRI